MKRINIWTIILILVSVYFIGLSAMEYRTSSIWEKYADEQFEIHLEDTPGIPFVEDLRSMSETQLEEWNNENTIKKLQYAINDNENNDRYLGWLIRARIHFQMALLSILLTIISWRFDSLEKKRNIRK